MRKQLCILLIVLLIHPSFATTRNAATCSQADITTQINAASLGDTIQVPAGSCTWSGASGVAPVVGLHLVGAGIGATNITDTTTGAGFDLISGSTTNFYEVTGFTFIAGVTKSRGMVEVDGTMMSPSSFRIHHNRFVANSFGPRLISITNVFGLIDHNTFDVGFNGSVQSISTTGSSDGTDGGFTPWMQPLSLGTNNAVFEEDNAFNYTFHAESAIDNYGGARYVFRHNAVNNAEACGGHGTDSGNRRSPFSFECYANTYTNNSGGMIRAGTIRGGTGVWYSNSFSASGVGSGYNGMTLMLYRACLGDQSGWHQCNGTNWQINSKNFSANGSRTTSVYAGTTDATHVSFCSVHRDTVCSSDADCTGGGGTCTTFFDGSGNGGYACRDQPGRTHDQVLDPIYAWSNTGPGNSIGTYDGGGTCNDGGIDNYMLAGRDFIDNGTTPKPGYTAFTYPHPLQGGGAPSATSITGQVTITGSVPAIH